MRIVVCGKGWFGAETFHLVRRLEHEVVLVTAPDRIGPPDRLFAAAMAAGVPVVTPAALRASAIPPDTDLLLAAHVSHYLPADVRAATRLGALGYHPSLLPVHRGGDAVRWAIHNRERITGGTVFWLTDAVDAGPVAAQAPVFIRPDDTARSLWERELAPLGLQLFERVLQELATGVVTRVPQHEALATWEPSFDVLPLSAARTTATTAATCQQVDAGRLPKRGE